MRKFLKRSRRPVSGFGSGPVQTQRPQPSPRRLGLLQIPLSGFPVANPFMRPGPGPGNPKRG